MSGNSPSNPGSNSQLFPVQEQLYKRRQPGDFYRSDFFTAFPTPNNRKILYSLSGRERAVLDALLGLWNYRQRDIETSISQINRKLEECGANIGSQHISAAVSSLDKLKIISKLKSGPNSLLIRINPFMFWKGTPSANNTARANEALTWGDVFASPNHRLEIF